MDSTGCRDRVRMHLRKIAAAVTVLVVKYRCILLGFSIITGVGVVVFRNFLLGSDWPAGGDILGCISRAYLYGKDFRWLYVWHHQSFGFVEGVDSMDFFLMLIYSILRDGPTTVKIFMFSSFLIAGFSMYVFAYYYTRRHVAALSASLVYMLNQWIFSQFTEGHVRIVFSYALAPLLFLMLDRALKEGKAKDILLLSLGLALFITSFHPECIVIYGFFLVVFVIIHVLRPTETDNLYVRFKRVLKISLLSVILCFFMSAFSLIPFLLNVRAPYYSPTYAYPLEDAVGCSYVNVFDAFTLRAVENLGYSSLVDIPSGLGFPDFPVFALLLCLFSLAYSTILVRRDKYTAFFAISALVSIFVSKGPHPPFGDIFVWAWFNIPHFAVFRAANRWVMMAALSHAFFVSILVSVLVDYVKRKQHLRVGELFIRASTKISESGKVKQVYVSVGILNRFMKKLHTFLYYSGVLLLVLLFLSGVLSCWFFFSQGLQVYTPPQSYLEPYEWIAEQPGDYKVVTVGQSSDFAHVRMTTDVGWSHDVGWESSFIHDKPTLQDGGWTPLSRDFVNYLRFEVVPQNMTEGLLKILGALDYKYVILPPYANVTVRDFFLNQQGSHVVYNQSSFILENKFHTPQIFAPTQHVVIVGGLESFHSLSKIDSFNFNETAMVFAHQIDETSPISHSLFNSSKALIFVDSELLDLIMFSLKDDAYFINAAEYGVSSVNDTRYWIRSLPWRSFGGPVLGGSTLTTTGKSRVDIPFVVNSDGTYDIWVRVEFSSDRGKLSVSVDGDLGEEIELQSSFLSRLSWVNVTRLYLGKGEHVVTLSNDGTGCNDVDSIAIVDPSLFQTERDEVLNILRTYSGRLIYMLEAENAFDYDLSGGWSLVLSPYNGFVFHTEGNRNVSPEGNVSASSEFPGLEADGAIDGNLATRWASMGSMPHWLQIEWATPRNLTGVHIVFETALAEDYVIQTWNGINWVNQVNITGNTLLERFHNFQQSVQTMKLRIYVTCVDGWSQISLWELEAYERPTMSTNVYIPREGRYMFALRLASGPDKGTLNLRINNVTAAISCFNSSAGFEWYEIGPIYLNVGEQMITLSGIGEVDFDEMIFYLLENGEITISLNRLFKSSSSPPSIRLERVSSCEYNVHINSNQPFLLIFSDAYHSLWRAYIEGTEVLPIIAYSFVNGFVVNKTGEFDIRLYFTGQIYADIGLRVSTITIVAAVAILIVPSGVFRRLRHKFERKGQSRHVDT